MPDYSVDAHGRVRATGPMWKGTKEEARAERDREKQSVKDKEDRNKTLARKRDQSMCRFPRCACHQKRLVPEVAHVAPKSAGGDHGLRSGTDNLICLCRLRHRESRISIHAGTLRVEALSVDGMNGPVRWWVNVAILDNPFAKLEDADWQCVAEESSVRVLKPPTADQGALLERIKELAA
jgi:hypothetical protein